MEQEFSVGVARRLGLERAVILKVLGDYCYTIKELVEKCPYFKESTIRYCVKDLEEKGFIKFCRESSCEKMYFLSKDCCQWIRCIDEE